MNKIAFFYNLGYQMAKKAADPKTEATKQVAKTGPSILKQLLRIWRAGLGLGRKDIIGTQLPLFGGEGEQLTKIKPYLENLSEAWRAAGTPAKALAVGLPAAGLGGAGYGTYKATRKKKSRLERLLGL